MFDFAKKIFWCANMEPSEARSADNIAAASGSGYN
jgi:hypothetical protein